ncbi:hypothetical protein COLO4_36043 [Corchorus olitorius]|uniref:RNase H type-1 domain-containing protein n=1 Tax=Corchorus olitorius TaxID=93759 RepID=A0A1R3GB84_9ROSI|nr:hypothetical protein COLO4_36043 [Corchorus olitorius]
MKLEHISFLMNAKKLKSMKQSIAEYEAANVVSVEDLNLAGRMKLQKIIVETDSQEVFKAVNKTQKCF